MISHDAYISGISVVLTVASLQRLKLEVLIPVPTDCEVRSVIKFLNAQSHDGDRNASSSVPSPWPHMARRLKHLLKEFGWEVFIIHSIVRTSTPAISIFSYTSRNSNSSPDSVSVFRVTKRRRWVVIIPGGKLIRNWKKKKKKGSYGMKTVSIPEVNVLKNSSTLAVSIPISLSIKFFL